MIFKSFSASVTCKFKLFVCVYIYIYINIKYNVDNLPTKTDVFVTGTEYEIPKCLLALRLKGGLA
jgi:hypothetical protein